MELNIFSKPHVIKCGESSALGLKIVQKFKDKGWITSLLRKFIERQDYVEPTPEYFDKVRSLIIRKLTN